MSCLLNVERKDPVSNRIMFLNIYRGREFDESFQRYIDSRFQGSPEVVVRSFDEELRSSQPSYLHQLGPHRYESLTLPDTLRMIVESESDGFDAAVIGCYCDPALIEAREVADRLVITAPAEASMLLATTMGQRFSTLVPTRELVSPMALTVTSYGLNEKCASLRPIGMGVHELQKDPQATLACLEQVGRQAIKEDYADVIILGCTDFFGMHAELQSILGRPVIDCVLASVAFADFLADAKKNLGYGYMSVTA